MINVVCGIVENDGRIFIARKKEGKELAGFWEFPGGKVEHNEDEKDALKRELLEELGMTVTVVERLGNNVHNYSNIKINLVAYRCVFYKATFIMTDHDDYAWIDKNELKNYNMAPADRPIIDYIK